MKLVRAQLEFQKKTKAIINGNKKRATIGHLTTLFCMYDNT